MYLYPPSLQKKLKYSIVSASIVGKSVWPPYEHITTTSFYIGSRIELPRPVPGPIMALGLLGSGSLPFRPTN
jgi:hypothetical protein